MSERTTLIKSLDREFSKLIRLRDGRCITCGELILLNEAGDPVTLNNGHYIRRSVQSLRWDERNCNCQCAPCNGVHEVNPEPYRRKMIEKYGDGIIEELEKIYLENRLKKITTPQLREMLKDIKQKYKEMKDEML